MEPPSRFQSVTELARRGWAAAPTQAVVRACQRTWRWWPVAFVLFGILYFGVQSLAEPSSDVPIGTTVTMAQLQRAPVLVTIRNLVVGRIPPHDRVVREVRFSVSMQMKHPADSMMSGDGLASYCSVLGSDGALYPSDLARSSEDASLGIFVLSGKGVRSGRVLAYVPAYAVVSGVSCQLGDDVENWLRS